MTKTVCITGGNSGIGEALAYRYAAEGARVIIIGRNQVRLDAVVAKIQSLGQQAHAFACDLNNTDLIAPMFQKIDAKFPIDLLILNAGHSLNQVKKTTPDAYRADMVMIDVHVKAVFASIHAVLPAMRSRGMGQIAIMSSLNGFMLLPGSITYGPLKSCVLNYGLALRAECRTSGILVSVITPGWVDTPLLSNKTFKKYALTSAEAAKRIVSGLAKNKAIIAFPFFFYTVIRCLSMLPYELQAKIYEWCQRYRKN